MRYWRRAAPLAAVGVALAVALGVASCGGSKKHQPPAPSPTPSVSATTAAPSIPHRADPPTTMFEDPKQLSTNPAATLDTLRSLGVNTVRIYMAWGGLAPDPTSRTAPAGFDPTSPSAYPAAVWQVYDAIVQAAAARGIGVMLTPQGPPPLWAAGPGAPAGTPDGGADWRPSASAFESFMRAVATRYSGSYTPPGSPSPLPRVKQWSIWNEPNYGPTLAPQAVEDSKVEAAPAIYRGLTDAAWTALHATGHSSDTILIGELAPRGITGPNYPGNFSGMVPLRFLRALYCVDGSLHKLTGAAATARGCPATAAASRSFAQDHPALFEATGLALHPYPQGALAPNVVTPGQPDYADMAALPKVESLIDRLTSTYGSHKHLPIYNTEFGYKTNPPYSAGAPMAKAALYLNWAEYLSWRDPRIRTWNQYLLVDPPPAQSKFVTGLEFTNGTPKPIYDPWRLPIYLPQTGGHRSVAFEVWGCARPVLFAHGRDHVSIQFMAPGGGAFKTVRTVKVKPDNCYFDVPVKFPSSGTVQLSWSAPGQTGIHSRRVQITLS